MSSNKRRNTLMAILIDVIISLKLLYDFIQIKTSSDKDNERPFMKLAS